MILAEEEEKKVRKISGRVRGFYGGNLQVGRVGGALLAHGCATRAGGSGSGPGSLGFEPHGLPAQRPWICSDVEDH